MRIRSSKWGWLAGVGFISAVLFAINVAAQDSSNPTPPPNPKPTVSPNQTAPVQLSVEVWDVLKMVQAKVPDDTILAYINNSGRTYSLGPSEIIYLREQGASEPVLTAMLKHPNKGAIAITPVPAMPTPAAPAPVAPAASPSTPSPTLPPAVTETPAPVTTVAPAPVYVPPSPVYVAPPPPVYYYGPSYYYPPASLSFGFGFGYGWHGGYYGHGGYRGGGLHVHH